MYSRIDTELDIFLQRENVLMTLNVTSMILSIMANSLVIIASIQKQKVTKMFLVNLSVADLLVTIISMSIQLSKAITLEGSYGETVCKIANYLQGVHIAATIFSFTLMSVDRWLSVSPRPRLCSPGRKQALLLLLFVWFAALLLCIPLLLVATVRREQVTIISKTLGNKSTETRDVPFCTEEWTVLDSKKHFGIFFFTLVYAIPGLITIISYARMARTLCTVHPPFDMYEGSVSMQQGLKLIKEKKRMAWIMLLLALLFVTCWMPYNIMKLLLDTNWVDAKDFSMYLPYALFIGHANSAINPFIHTISKRNFYRSARMLLCGQGACQQPNCKMNARRYNMHRHGHAHVCGQTARDMETHAQTTQLSHVTRSTHRTAPARVLSADKLQHELANFKR